MAQFYSDDVIQEVSRSNDIVDVVSEYVKLKKSGNNLLGLCPFHREKTPSFSVSPDKQIFHCFGCGTGGNVFSFIMKVENLDFVETVKYLADRARIILPEGDFTDEEAKNYEKKQKILKINVDAARFFYKSLMSPQGSLAQQYLRKRGIIGETVKTFGLGFAQDSWHVLYDYLQGEGYTLDEILASGLVIRNEKNICYDRFRNRLMFPIIDIRGNVIGFGGRVLDDSLPKYLNSPETLVFNKSRNLYGLNLAKNSGSKDLVVVEGYMDVISLHQNGIINTIASLGTALTTEHANIIKKYCNEVILAYDTDSAGQAATLRAIDVMNGTGCKVRILTLSEGKDPDEYIRLKGPERFRRELQASKNLIEYRIDLLKKKYDLSDIEQKIEFVNEMAKIFSKVENSVERDAYLQKISAETGVAIHAISAEINKLMHNAGKKKIDLLKMGKNNPINNKTLPQEKPLASKNEFHGKRLINAEKMLVNLMCFDKQVFMRMRDLIKPSDFSSDLHKKIAELISELWENHPTVEATKILSKFGNEDIDAVTSILHMDANFEDNIKAALELYQTIQKEKDIYNIKASLKEGNVEKLNNLLIELKNK